MRNGVYRVWTKGLDSVFAGAVVLKDGEAFAVDKRYAYNGRYSERAGWLTAEIVCTRLFDETTSAPFPAGEHFAMTLQGAAGREFAKLDAAIDGNKVATIECAFLNEA